MNIERKTLSGTKMAVTFNYDCCRWLVKNFSSADVYVSFATSDTDDHSAKISAGESQVIVDNEYAHGGETLDGECWKKTIYVKGTGDVEIQQLCWRH